LQFLSLRTYRDGAQVKSLQESTFYVPLEVEEEAYPPSAKETPQDAPAFEVRFADPSDENDVQQI